MGQKTNPIGFRLGINKAWDSLWFDERRFADKLEGSISKIAIPTTINAKLNLFTFTLVLCMVKSLKRSYVFLGYFLVIYKSTF